MARALARSGLVPAATPAWPLAADGMLSAAAQTNAMSTIGSVCWRFMVSIMQIP